MQNLQGRIEIIQGLIKDLEKNVHDKNSNQYNLTLKAKEKEINKLSKEIEQWKNNLLEVRAERNEMVKKVKELTKDINNFNERVEQNIRVKNLKKDLKTKDKLINTLKKEKEKIAYDLYVSKIEAEKLEFKKRIDIHLRAVAVEFLNIIEKNIPNLESLKPTFNSIAKLGIIDARKWRKDTEIDKQANVKRTLSNIK